MSRRPVRPATREETRRASYLRARRRAGRTLAREQDAWLRRYTSDRKAFKRGKDKAPVALKRERDRAYRLRQKRKKGKTLTSDEREWLRRYEAQRRTSKAARAGKRPSARVEASRLAEAIVDWFGTGSSIESWWDRPSRPKFPGIALAESSWGDPVPPPEGELPELPVSSGRLANVRAEIAIEDDDDPKGFSLVWTSLMAMTDDWAEMAADLFARANRLMQQPYVMGFTGVSVMVSPKDGR